MAEIKSSIELAMERTKGLTFSDEERHRVEEDKDRRAAHGLLSQYLRGEVSLAELTRKKDSSSVAFREALMREMVVGLRLGREEFSRGLDALEQWQGRQSRPLLNRIRDLSMQFGQSLQKRRRKVKADLWEDLARRGLEGSAVEPNVEGSTQWRDLVEALAREFDPRIEEIRSALLAEATEAHR
jgi:hypothetical protein